MTSVTSPKTRSSKKDIGKKLTKAEKKRQREEFHLQQLNAAKQAAKELLDIARRTNVIEDLLKRLTLNKTNPLTPSEQKFAALFANSRLSNKGMARSLSISERTVEPYMVSIPKKLGLNNRWELAALLSTEIISAITRQPEPPKPHEMKECWREYLGLTGQERETAALLIEGKSNKEIAEKLHTSLRTVESYVAGIYEKTGENSRPKAIFFLIAAASLAQRKTSDPAPVRDESLGVKGSGGQKPDDLRS